VFSISPSEICDERTASRLRWFNAACWSYMVPETLIDCGKLYDHFTHSFTVDSTLIIMLTFIFQKEYQWH
jgi:hypothetical protein